MKLYLSPGACSMSCHIAFEEAGQQFEPMISRKDEVEKLNPMGAVPVLVLDNGTVLTQNIAILTHVAELKPASGLLPAMGSIERAQTYQWLSFVASDLHPAFGPFFGKLSDSERAESVEEVGTLLKIVERHLADKPFLIGQQFTAADAYLFVVYGWSKHVKIPTDAYPNLNAHSARVFERPAVQRAMKREGLI